MDNEISSEIKKPYNKKYYENFKNKEKKFHCDICNKDYLYYSKSNHLKSKTHKLIEELKILQNNI
jgi:hypothetical protein